MKTQFAILLAAMLTVSASIADLSREAGISIHYFPSRVAKIGGQKSGYAITTLGGRKITHGDFVLGSNEELIAFYRKQPKEIQTNGIWIVYTHPDAYSEAEMQRLERLKEASRRGSIPLFICRAGELPNGWKRHDKQPEPQRGAEPSSAVAPEGRSR